MRFALIMAGGSGTRFWPKSSAKRPKQLLPLTGKRSQIQLTFDRLQGVVDKKNRWVVGTELLARATKAQLPQTRVLAEPVGRNTMAAVCWGAWEIHRHDPDASVIALPADAHVLDVPAYQQAVREAFDVAEKNERVVCLGIKPRFAATGYGYIQKGTLLSPVSDGQAFSIQQFIEKPNEARARELLASGEYQWNAGIFVFRVKDVMDEARQFAPDIAAFFDKTISTPKKLRAGYAKIPKVSFDVGLMEKTSKGAVVQGDFGWNDVGSWRALEEVMPSNSPAGLVAAPGGHISIDSEGVIADLNSKKFLGLVGVKDLIIVETESALLVCHKSKAEQVKDLVAAIEKNKKFNKLL